MCIRIRPVAGRMDLKEFIFLPERIHVHHDTWVHPLYLHEWQYYDPRKNPAMTHCDRILLLACKGDEVVGRVMGLINHRYNEIRNEKTARFASLETWEDEQAVHMLLAGVEDWARDKGMTKIVGPYGYSDQDPEGFIVEGFEHHATIGTYCNFEWMVRFVENAGYRKEIDYVTYRINVPREDSELHQRIAVYERIYERIRKRNSFEVVEFTTKKAAGQWAKPVFHLMNECYTDSAIYGYNPLNEDEMNLLLKRYMPLIDPRFLKLIKKRDEVVGFIIGIPDMTAGIRTARGRLLPFGFLKIFRASHKARQLDLLLGAVKEEYRGLGLDGLLVVKMGISAYQAGMEVVDTHHVMETNKKMRQEYERLGGELYKRFRVYQKLL